MSNKVIILVRITNNPDPAKVWRVWDCCDRGSTSYDDYLRQAYDYLNSVGEHPGSMTIDRNEDWIKAHVEY